MREKQPPIENIMTAADMAPLDVDFDISDADLEAELLALEGKSPGKGKSPKSGGRGGMTMADLDKVMADVDKIGEDDDGEDLSDIDDDDLLGELQVHRFIPASQLIPAWLSTERVS